MKATKAELWKIIDWFIKNYLDEICVIQDNYPEKELSEGIADEIESKCYWNTENPNQEYDEEKCVECTKYTLVSWAKKQLEKEVTNENTDKT